MKKIDLIIKAQYLLTMDKQKTYYKKPRAIAVDQGKIVAIDKPEIIDKLYIAEETLDKPNHLAMPGFINTHTHIAMSLLRGFADDLPLETWLRQYIWPVESLIVNSHNVKLGSELGLLELIRSGITTYNDMYFFSQETAIETKKAGLRAVLSFGSTPYFSKDKLFQYAEDFINKWKSDTHIQPAIGPHGPSTVPEDKLIKWHALAKKHNVHFHIHVSETRDECKTIMDMYQTTPVQFLYNHGMLDKMTIAAHCVHLTDEDINILAQTKCQISHNPESNMKLGSGHCPITRLHEAGVNLSLGTDGPSSNNNMNMFTAMKHTALLQKFADNDPTAAPAQNVVEMATIKGAKALNIDDRVGSLEVGKEADIILIDTYKSHILPFTDPYSSIVYAMHGEDVSSVIVRGKIIMQDHKILTMDENDILDRSAEFSKTLPLREDVAKMDPIS